MVDATRSVPIPNRVRKKRRRGRLVALSQESEETCFEQEQEGADGGTWRSS